MKFQREHQNSSLIPKPIQKTSQFASRPFSIQPQESGMSLTQEQIENKTFEQQKFEATGLEIKQKDGSITPQEQKRLGVLQTKMDGLLAQRVERASRFGHNFANIAVNSPDSSEPAPIQTKLTIGQSVNKYEQEANSVAHRVVNHINQPQSLIIQRDGEDDQQTFQNRLAFWQNMDSKSRDTNDQSSGSDNQSQTTHRPTSQFNQLKYWRDLEKQNQPQGNTNQSQTTHHQRHKLNQLEYWRDLEKSKNAGNNSQSKLITTGSRLPNLKAEDLSDSMAPNSKNESALDSRMPDSKAGSTSDSIAPNSKTVSDTQLDGIHPIVSKTEQLKSIKELSGGANGVVFLVEYDNGHKMVIKFEEIEEPKDAIIGTQILKEVGVNTPNIRIAKSTELKNIINSLNQLQQKTEEFSKTTKKFLDVNVQNANSCLLMDFVPGETATEMMNKKPDDFIKVLQDKQFQKDLGKILAADAFSGNPDRAMAYAKSSHEIMAWFNSNNLFINQVNDGFSAVAIDNKFKGSGVVIEDDSVEEKGNFLKTPKLPYGEFPDYKENLNFISSLAAANEIYFKEELRIIFDHIIERIKKIYVHSNKEREQGMLDIKTIQEKKDEFIENVAKSAKETMTKLLKRGQNRQGRLEEGGANAQDIEAFRERKRYIRLIENNVEPEEAYEIARSQEEYRFWVLTEQLKLSSKEAKEILKQGDKAYKQKVKEMNI